MAKKDRKAKKDASKASDQFKKPKEDKLKSQTQSMVDNMRKFTRDELSKLEQASDGNEPQDALMDSIPGISPEHAQEFLEIQKKAMGMLSDVLQEADEKLNPVDKKAKYADLPLDVDHFFAELGLPEELKSYNKMIHTCAVRGDVEKGLQAFEQMKKYTNFEPDVYTYNSLILLQRANPGRVGMEQALRLYEEMTSNAVVPTVHTFGSLISVCAKAQDEGQVKRFLQEMDERGIERTPHIATSVMTMYLEMNKLEGIWEEYYDMMYHGALPDDVTYALLFRVCARTKEVERGLALLNDMRMDSMVPSARTFNTAIYMCAQRPEFYAEAFGLFGEMVDAGHVPNRYTLSNLLLTCANAGDVANSIRLSRQFIHTYGIELDISHYERIFHAIAESMMKPSINLNDDDQSEELAFLGHNTPTARRELAKKADLSAPERRKDRIQLAESVMKDMLDQGFKPNSRVVNQYFRVYAAAAGPAPPPGPDKRKKLEEAGSEEDLKRAEEMFESVHERFGLTKDDHTYYFMLQTYANRRGEEERFTAFLDRIRKDGIPLELPQYNLILERYERMEDYEAFLDTIHEMHMKNKKVNDYWRQYGENIIEEVIQAREKRKVQKASAELKKQSKLKW